MTGTPAPRRIGDQIAEIATDIERAGHLAGIAEDIVEDWIGGGAPAREDLARLQSLCALAKATIEDGVKRLDALECRKAAA